jgi:hypothetical protein
MVDGRWKISFGFRVRILTTFFRAKICVEERTKEALDEQSELSTLAASSWFSCLFYGAYRQQSCMTHD